MVFILFIKPENEIKIISHQLKTPFARKVGLWHIVAAEQETGQVRAGGVGNKQVDDLSKSCLSLIPWIFLIGNDLVEPV